MPGLFQVLALLSYISVSYAALQDHALGSPGSAMISHNAHVQSNFHSYHGYHRQIRNNTLVGSTRGCKHKSEYFVTPTAQVPMCMGQSDQDLKNGQSIINLIYSRGYLPTCRVLHLMLWMAAEATDKHSVPNDYFIDVGANIGSCSVHIAALGFPVVAFEPVQQHIDTIRGSIDLNPSFHIDLHYAGVSYADRKVKVNFGHGGRNWGASEFHEVSVNETYEAELELRSLDRVLSNKKVGLMKVDCEGCEFEALKGAKKALKRIPMMKIELVQPSYTVGNETYPSIEVLRYLAPTFSLFIDPYNEAPLYFGKRGTEVLDIDRLFGSGKFKLPADKAELDQAARKILQGEIVVDKWERGAFLKQGTDVIAIEKGLAERMKRKWGVSSS